MEFFQTTSFSNKVNAHFQHLESEHRVAGIMSPKTVIKYEVGLLCNLAAKLYYDFTQELAGLQTSIRESIFVQEAPVLVCGKE
jgi:hypothetical protein